MCFSPEASFIAAAFLTIMSVVSWVKVKQQGFEQAKKKALLLVPVGFALQQFCEGFVWLSLLNNYSDLVRNLAVYGFTFFAFIFWPAYLPWCMYYLESNEIRKDVLKGFMWMGSILAALLLTRIAFFGVLAQIASCHIMYDAGMGSWNWFSVMMMAVYLLVTVGALLVSSFSKMRTLGVLVGIAYLVAYLFYLNFLTSVWCFFAAVVSLFLYQIF